MDEAQKYFVVGTPIAHSLSPRLHNAVYQELGLARELEPHDPKDAAGFADLISRLRAGELAGICSTIPYKLAALRACDTLTPPAQRTGAVNYIRREVDGSLRGDNTDAQGFAQALKRELDFNSAQKTAVVCGSGGASRAIVDALIQEGALSIALVSRDPAKAAREWKIPNLSHKQTSKFMLEPLTVSERHSTSLGTTTTLGAIDYETLEHTDTYIDLLVNSTPLGMNDERMPVSKAWLHSTGPAIYDAVYRKEGTTPLVAAAREVGIPASDGRSMLIEQAILGMRFWGVNTEPTLLRSIIDISLA